MNQFSYLQKFCFAALFCFVLSSLETATEHVKKNYLKVHICSFALCLVCFCTVLLMGCFELAHVG